MFDNDLKHFLSKEKTDEEQLNFFQKYLEEEEKETLPNSKLSNLLSPCYKCENYIYNYQKKEINNNFFCRECFTQESKKEQNMELEEEDIKENNLELEKMNLEIEEIEKFDLLEELKLANKRHKENKKKLPNEIKKNFNADLKTFEKHFEKYPLWIQKDFSLNWKKFEDIIYNVDEQNKKKNLDLIGKFFENRKIDKDINKEFLKKYELDITFLNNCYYTLQKKKDYIYFFGAISNDKDFVKFNLKNNFKEKFVKEFPIKKKEEFRSICNKEIQKMQNLEEKLLSNKSYIFKIKKIAKSEFNFFKLLINIRKKQQYSDYLEKSQQKGTKIIQKIQKKSKKDEKKPSQSTTLKNAKNFLKYMSNLRKYKRIFTQYPQIESEIKYYLEHTKNFTLKTPNTSKNTKNKLEIIDSDCAVCFSSEVSYYNNVIYCHNCKQGAHLKCLDKTEAPPGNYYCFKCFDRTRSEIICCLLCGSNDHFLKQSKISNYKKSCIYHGFCLFTTKSWSIIYQGIQPCVKSDDCCSICYKTKGYIIKCYDCKESSFHQFCAYFEGFYFFLNGIEKILFNDFIAGVYKYEIRVFCKECSSKKFVNKKDIVKKNSYYRKLSIMPEFFRDFPSFEDFRDKDKDCN